MITKMTNNMSNEEVIEVLKGIVFNSFDRTTPKERQALHLAIKSLEARPQGDCEKCDYSKLCEKCDYRKFTEKCIDVMTDNGITSVEQLSEILKGDANV